ncbi:hypothetical protein KIL84_006630 [Mauremys mutica]|uniref:Uncharacterized protein n=1 Tax=Mauremys mutica TaxID=74926 RepID=A0A9D4APL4_9SAUR|nr:hypothetical protein KIL84_006630 [Mauremys mutica]
MLIKINLKYLVINSSGVTQQVPETGMGTYYYKRRVYCHGTLGSFSINIRASNMFDKSSAPVPPCVKFQLATGTDQATLRTGNQDPTTKHSYQVHPMFIHFCFICSPFRSFT